MRLFVLTPLLGLCLVHMNAAVDIGPLRAQYEDLGPDIWQQILSGVIKPPKDGGLVGRAGFALNLPTDFFDERCKTTTEKVGNQADICFIVQTSCRETKKVQSDILESVYTDIKDILKNLHNETRFAVVPYSGKIKKNPQWLKRTKQVKELIKPGKNCDDCRAVTYEALDACRKFLKESNSANDVIPDNIVIFTDGISVDQKYNMPTARRKTNQASVDIKKEGTINMQVVRMHPISKSVDLNGNEEWNAMKVRYGRDKITIRELGLRNKQTVDIAVTASTKEDTEVDPCCTADVVFILDRSNSIRKPDVDRLLEFFADFIDAQQKILQPKKKDRHEGLQIALLTYGPTVEVHSSLGQHGKAGLIDVAKKIPRTTNKYTSTHLALEAAGHQLNGKRARKEPHVRKIVVIATDGRTWKVNERNVDSGEDTIAAARKLKKDKVEIYVVGLPNHDENNDGYEREWKHMASKSINCTIVNMQKLDENGKRESFDQLKYVGIHLTEEICTNRKGIKCRWNEE
ncbi:unnamed protein product [Owenia fusiformis]|uniref:Uncharacterized protein n=1 Tax=Owenia fusiformis TaxID=6347 RepID=A0A8J1YAU0_OWEFU|nr:unnamed protein product [Owenia fusiformis]